MKKSTRFSDMLHVLLHMDGFKEPATSATLAKIMNTNAVFVRKVMAGLRERGFVTSEKGHGGGWRLSCDLDDVTLYDVYKAIGSPKMFAIGNRADSPDCLVERAVNSATKSVFADAESMLINKFRNITLADLHKIIKKHSNGKGHIKGR